MCPIRGKWQVEDKAMLAAEGVIEDSDILQLIDRVLTGDLVSIAEVYIDLSKVRSVSPFAIAHLYGLYPKLTATGKRLMFMNPNDISRSLLRLFGADHVFPVVMGA